MYCHWTSTGVVFTSPCNSFSDSVQGRNNIAAVCKNGFNRRYAHLYLPHLTATLGFPFQTPSIHVHTLYTLATYPSRQYMAKIPTETVTYTSGDLTTPPALRLLHYNDVYHVEAGSREPVGGIARFQTLCNYYRNDDKFAGQPELLTLFSGDAFNPSLESTVTKGKTVARSRLL